MKAEIRQLEDVASRRATEIDSAISAMQTIEYIDNETKSCLDNVPSGDDPSELHIYLSDVRERLNAARRGDAVRGDTRDTNVQP